MLPISSLSLWTSCLLFITTHAGTIPTRSTNISLPLNSQVAQADYNIAPPFPILEIASKYVLSQMGVNTSKAQNDSIIAIAENATFVIPIPNTPKVTAQCGISFPCEATSTTYQNQTSEVDHLHKRDSPVQCGPGQPCVDGSCCNTQGQCGFSPYNCVTTSVSSCISNCDAKAMCGNFSLNAAQKCPLNLCCSYFGYCGTSSAFCAAPSPTQCQQGYGSCQVIPPPSCNPLQKSASNGRKIAYWAVGNLRWRNCNRIDPSQIDTTSITHLIYAFVSINATAQDFSVIPADPNDVNIIPSFTDLKTTTMQTWVAVGGFDFSNPGPTHTTWSNMTSTSTNRAIFIQSLISFITEWGFQGVDLDWEFPAQSSRGGNPSDNANLVSLVQEMRAAFGTNFGISIALPPDFVNLSGFYPVLLAQYVDFFNFMAYDLHGSWESSTLGPQVRAQTSILDIGNALSLLWFDGVPPSKINLGLAYYGRGYTLSSPSCKDIGCPYTGPNNAGNCTATAGLLGLWEIENLIEEQGLTPNLLSDEMIKEIVFDGNQWVGYDDSDTFAMKKAWADGLCLGGTMIWSIDLYSGIGSGNNPITTTTDGRCGLSSDSASATCLGSTYGNCCSASDWCGSTNDHCSPSNGCQFDFGLCSTQEQNQVVVSTDGSCGNEDGQVTTCNGSGFGNCCSSYGWCGRGSAYCAAGNGCQSQFGVCH